MTATTPDTLERHIIIEDRFAYLADGLSLQLVRYHPDEWVAHAPDDATNLHRPYGYMPTVDHATLHYCPAMILEQTEVLRDDAFSAYVDAVDVHIVKHFEFYGQPNVETRVLDFMYEIGPGSVKLMNEVAAMVIDRRNDERS